MWQPDRCQGKMGRGTGGGGISVGLPYRFIKTRGGGVPGADPGFRRRGFVQEFRSYPDVHDFSLRMQVIIAND